MFDFGFEKFKIKIAKLDLEMLFTEIKLKSINNSEIEIPTSEIPQCIFPNPNSL